MSLSDDVGKRIGWVGEYLAGQGDICISIGNTFTQFREIKTLVIFYSCSTADIQYIF